MGGENINIGSLEDILCCFSGCSEISVFSISDLRLDEIVCAFFTIKYFGISNRDELARFCQTNHISGFRTPQFAIFSLKTLPRNGLWKILKNVLSRSFEILLKGEER